jgi:hypothetical protein
MPRGGRLRSPGSAARRAAALARICRVEGGCARPDLPRSARDAQPAVPSLVDVAPRPESAIDRRCGDDSGSDGWTAARRGEPIAALAGKRYGRHGCQGALRIAWRT